MPKKGKPGPSPAIADRLKRCRSLMADDGTSALLVTNHMDSFYLTGFTGEDSAILLTPRATHIISDARFDQAIDTETPWAKKHLRKGSLVAEIGKLCTRLGIEELAIQPEWTSVETHRMLRSAARPTKLVHASPILNRMRRKKDRTELAIMRKAILIAEEAFTATLPAIRVGVTEVEVAARLEFEMRSRGASGPSFGTICAVGANASHPHAHTGNRKIKSGSGVLIDWGARFGFYCSDLTRVVFVDKIPPRIGKIYKIVLEAQLAAIDAIQPGCRMCDVDDVARRIIKKAGFGKQFGHGLGHGLGLDVHESPSLSWRSDEPLEEGMVVTVEPGIYLPGVGGVRIEDDVLVTSGGHRVLSSLCKDLQGAVL
jgi:Xaa-Pro aminopeptidase